MTTVDTANATSSITDCTAIRKSRRSWAVGTQAGAPRNTHNARTRIAVAACGVPNAARDRLRQQEQGQGQDRVARQRQRERRRCHRVEVLLRRTQQGGVDAELGDLPDQGEHDDRHGVDAEVLRCEQPCRHDARHQAARLQRDDPGRVPRGPPHDPSTEAASVRGGRPTGSLRARGVRRWDRPPTVRSSLAAPRRSLLRFRRAYRLLDLRPRATPLLRRRGATARSSAPAPVTGSRRRRDRCQPGTPSSLVRPGRDRPPSARGAPAARRHGPRDRPAPAGPRTPRPRAGCCAAAARRRRAASWRRGGRASAKPLVSSRSISANRTTGSGDARAEGA